MRSYRSRRLASQTPQPPFRPKRRRPGSTPRARWRDGPTGLLCGGRGGTNGSVLGMSSSGYLQVVEDESEVAVAEDGGKTRGAARRIEQAHSLRGRPSGPGARLLGVRSEWLD